MCSRFCALSLLIKQLTAEYASASITELHAGPHLSCWTGINDLGINISCCKNRSDKIFNIASGSVIFDVLAWRVFDKPLLNLIARANGEALEKTLWYWRNSTIFVPWSSSWGGFDMDIFFAISLCRASSFLPSCLCSDMMLVNVGLNKFRFLKASSWSELNVKPCHFTFCTSFVQMTSLSRRSWSIWRLSSSKLAKPQSSVFSSQASWRSWWGYGTPEPGWGSGRGRPASLSSPPRPPTSPCRSLCKIIFMPWFTKSLTTPTWWSIQVTDLGKYKREGLEVIWRRASPNLVCTVAVQCFLACSMYGIVLSLLFSMNSMTMLMSENVCWTCALLNLVPSEVALAAFS